MAKIQKEEYIKSLNETNNSKDKTDYKPSTTKNMVKQGEPEAVTHNWTV